MSDLPQLLRRVLFGLVIGLPLVVIVYAVIMGGAALLATLGDANGALALRWIGFVLALLFVAGALSLLLLIGWERVSREE
jgi:hypothetical protein